MTEEVKKYHFIGDYLTKLRQEKGLSRRKLTDATGNKISESYLYLIEKNREIKISPLKIKILSSILGHYEELMEMAGYSCEPYKHVGDLVRELRVSKGLTHNKIVELTGYKITSTYIANIEKRKNIPSPQKIKLLASILGYYDELMELAGYDNLLNESNVFFLPVLADYHQYYNYEMSRFEINKQIITSYLPWPHSMHFWNGEELFVIKVNKENAWLLDYPLNTFVLFKLSSKPEKGDVIAVINDSNRIILKRFQQKPTFYSMSKEKIIGVKVAKLDFGSL